MFNSATRDVKRQNTLILVNIKANGNNYKRNMLKINASKEIQGNINGTKRGLKKMKTLKPQSNRFSNRHMLPEPLYVLYQ